MKEEVLVTIRDVIFDKRLNENETMFRATDYDLLEKVPVECKNCGHKSLLKDFFTSMSPVYSREYSHNTPSFSYASPATSTTTNLMTDKYYDRRIFCPKCKSSYVIVCKGHENNFKALLAVREL